MAQRRMFSPDIVESDAFLEMPISSQALYFHLGMFADDDGFVNPRKIMRMVGVSDDDLKVLLTKRFVLSFESGVIVIKHWKINNLVRKDWYRPTQYVEEKSKLTLKENGSYTELSRVQSLYVTDSVTVRPRRLGKVRLGKVSNNSEGATRKTKRVMYTPLGAEVIKAFEGVDPKNKTNYSNRTQRAACDFLIAEHGLEKVLAAIKVLPAINQKKLYVGQTTTPYELKVNWVKIKNALAQEKSVLNVKNQQVIW